MKFLPLLFLAFGLMYCKSDTNNVLSIQERIESYLKSKGLDMTSYEFVSVTKPDTVTERGYLDREMEILTLALMNKPDRIKRMDSLEATFRKTLSHDPKDETATLNLKDITSAKASMVTQQHKLDSLTSAIKPEMSQVIKFIDVTYSFNKKNNKGVKILHKYYIKFDKDLNVTDVSELIN